MCASQIKLVHQSGYVNCRGNGRGESNYGCNGNTDLAVHITDDNSPCRSCSIAPASDDGSVAGDKNGWWFKRGYTSDSAQVILDLPRKKYCFVTDDTYHIWHAEDKNDGSEGDNHGTAKDHVYLYVEGTTTATTVTKTKTATTITATTKTATTGTTTTLTTKTTTTVRACSAGEYLDAASNECRECPDGTYQPDDGHKKTKCEKIKDKCSFREFIVSNGTKIANIVCQTSEKCAEDEWESKKVDYGKTERECTPLTQCEQGQYISKRATSRSDQACSECDNSYQARVGGCTTTTSTRTTRTRTTKTYTTATATTATKTSTTTVTTATATTTTTTTTLNADQLAAIDISATLMKNELTLKGLSAEEQVKDLAGRGFTTVELVLAGYRKNDLLSANAGISESEFDKAEKDAADKALYLIAQAQEERTELSELMLVVPKENLDAAALLGAGFTEDELAEVGYTSREISRAAASSASALSDGNTQSNANANTSTIIAVVVVLILVAAAVVFIVVLKRRGSSDGIINPVSFENPMYDSYADQGGNVGGGGAYMDVPAASNDPEASYMDVNPLYSGDGGGQMSTGYMDVNPAAANVGDALEDRMASEMERMEADMGGFGGDGSGYMDVSPQENVMTADDGSDGEEV